MSATMATSKQLTKAAEDYFAGLWRMRASGGATPELSNYGPLTDLLNAMGNTLNPKVFCVSQLADQGAGHPDIGLYTAKQVQRGTPRQGQLPERGVVEVKPVGDDAWLTADAKQVSKYWKRYNLVLVTNLRDFVLLATDEAGSPAKLETFRLAESAEQFVEQLAKPQALAREAGTALGEYLCRALAHRATLTEPKDLAWLLASYARDGLARVEAADDAPSLAAVRDALEEALGVRFEGEKGAAFFRSTLVQTLFYGVFSAWVLWARATLSPTEKFNWHETAWHLRVPVLQALFQQLSGPGYLHPLGLVEVLDWTAAALDRVDRGAFFAKFNEGEAVPYFYEPFLEAFDPALRKQLGVWYTPAEVVRYMVARVDRALKDDLGLPGGLAEENVYVLDPCCGTGAYLAEVLRRIAANLEGLGLGALTGAQVKRAALERVFGFEIMPAPFVVAHLQVGLTMQELDAPLSEDGNERAGVFLTNALTGWEPKAQKPLPFPELEEERRRSGRVKRVRRPEGQGLNDPYVRFFRMAERRIAEKTGRGVVCFISNYSWLDGLSFPGMRERYLEAFDAVRIDCLNGDKYETGKTTPGGEPDPSIFSTPEDPVGIQVGTAITTLVREAGHAPTKTVGFRHLWGRAKGEDLTATAETEADALYAAIEPILPLGLPFKPLAVSEDWFGWPSLPDLFPTSFPGVKTSRDSFLVDTDLDRLKKRLAAYFDPELSHEEIARRYPSVMKSTARFDALHVRAELRARGGPNEASFVPYTYRPFDTRWLYWEADTKLLDRKRADYKPHVFNGNRWLSAVPRLRRDSTEPQTTITSHLASLHLNEWSASMFPAWLSEDALGSKEPTRNLVPNLSDAAKRYLERLDLDVEDLFHHVLAVLHDPAYRQSNAGALRMEWPRIPLPGWPDGEAPGAAAELAASAARGRELAALLDPERPVPGVTDPPLRPEMVVIAEPATTDGSYLARDDFMVTAGWGHLGAGGAVMPGQGRVAERASLGETTFDVYLNDRACWRNVPAAVWRYKLGGYQVLKKWLSYREHKVLGRPLSPDEVQHFSDTARRIAAILQLVGGR